MRLHHHHPDPRIAELVDTGLSELGHILGRLGIAESPGADDAAPAASTRIDTEAAAAALERLCDEEDWHNGLALASRLFIAQPHEPRTAYLLATCMQRLGQHRAALSLFAHCGQLEGDEPTPGPLFRVGECLAAMQLPTAALEMFDSAIDLARCRGTHAEILGLATDKSQALRALP